VEVYIVADEERTQVPVEHPRTFSNIWILLLLLLAVVAILSILIPTNVGRYAEESRRVLALSELRNAETALIGLLSDASVSRFAAFVEPRRPDETAEAAIARHTDFFYELLRNGRYSRVESDRELLNELGDSYMDLGPDPWGDRYHFYGGNLADLADESAELVLLSYYAGSDPSRKQAPADLPVFIFSLGKNGRSDQPFAHTGDLPANGDDIGSW
jgi:hypothetical protein